MSKKSSTNTTQNTNTNLTQTPTNPAWVQSGLSGLGGQISNLSNADPYSYVAGPDTLQTQAAGTAANLTTNPGFAQAGSIFGDVAGQGANTYGATGYAPTTGTAASLLTNLPAYMSPYTNDVVNSTLADYDTSAGQTRAADALAKANDETFGGSGGAIQTTLSNDALNRGRATLEAQLRDQAFNTGAGLAGQDAGRAQDMTLANMGASNTAGQFNAGAANTAGAYNATAADTAAARALAAAQGLSGNATAAGADTRSNIDTQSTLGQILQQLAQAHATAPLATTGALASMFAGLPLSLLQGQTQNGTANSTGNSTTTVSDPMGTIGGLLSAGGSLASGLGSMGLAFSDRRLKRNIRCVSEWNGLRVYLYRYIWSPVLHLGVMAQDVLGVKPQAVVRHPSGFLMVDYGKL